MAVAPLIWMGASALGGYLAAKKGKKTPVPTQQPPAQADANQEVGAPAPPPAASQTTSDATKQANQVAQRTRRRAAAGNSGIVTPRGGVGGFGTGASPMSSVRTAIGG